MYALTESISNHSCSNACNWWNAYMTILADIIDRLDKRCKLIGHDKEPTSTVRRPQLTWLRAFLPAQPTPFDQDALLHCWAEASHGIFPWRCRTTCKKQLQLSRYVNVQNVQAYRPIGFAKKADEIARLGSTVAGRFWSNACHLITLASGNGLTDTKGESVNQLFRSSCNAQTLGSK